MTPDYWLTAQQALAKKDKTLAKIIRLHPNGILRKRGSAFTTLLRAIIGQQISVKAANSIWKRFVILAKRTTPKHVLHLTPAQLRTAGLSTQKARYILDLAAHFADGRIKPHKFKSMSDEELIAALTDVKGIGRWTAEMFLIFNLQRPDVFPVQDIGLIRAIEKHYFSGEKIPKEKIVAMGNAWNPWRSVATWYLWRSLDPLPVEY